MPCIVSSCFVLYDNGKTLPYMPLIGRVIKIAWSYRSPIGIFHIYIDILEIDYCYLLQIYTLKTLMYDESKRCLTMAK